MEVVELLKELIKRQSVTPNECGIYEIIKAELVDFEVIEIEKNGVKNLFLYKDFTSGNFAESNADSADSQNLGKNQTQFAESSLDSANKDEFAIKIHLCFAGHIDVVPAGFGWSVPPFDALVKDGVIYGRGAQDMKGGVAAFVSALQKVKNFNGILSVLLTSDEEGDGVFGTKIMLEHLKERGLLPHFAIVAEPTCEKKLGDSIKIGRRGSINGVLTIYGVQGHAAYPHKCVNPLDLIAPILTQISSKDLDNGSEYFAPSKIVITDIRGGIEATNVTPAKLKLMFNVRNNPLTDKNAIQNYIESLLKNAGIQKYDLSFSQSAFPFLGAESSVDSADSQNLVKKVSCEAPENSPASWCKKSESKGAEVPPADFLLEADKRGTPPKSEKAELFGAQGERGGGCSPFCEKESELSGENSGKVVESSLDSAILFNTLCNAIYKKTHIMPRPNTEGGTSDARYFSAFGVEVVEFGLVNDRIHAVDECVKIADLEALRDIFVDFVADFSSAPKSHNDRMSDSRNSTNPPQQTIEGIAVEVAEFLPNFECETRLGVCEHSKFGKSMQDAPKSELNAQDEF